MRIEGDKITFTSGRQEYANCGIIGIGPDMDISYGYDGGWEHDEWSAEEKRELADHMIELWTKYRNSLPSADR